MLRKNRAGRGLGGLFEPLRKPDGADHDPADDDGGGIPLGEPDMDGPSMPSEQPDRPWQV